MNLFPQRDETIAGLWPQIRSRQISCVEVLSRCLRRIDETEDQIRAWVLIDRDQAMQAARALDAELEAGQYRGPLHGIPIGIKDIIDVQGWPTAAGSSLWKDRVAACDATLVSRLREAGAVLLGKTVTTQYASFDPSVTRNPWNLERTPGGSSSGSAAAVAAGMCLAAIGSQTGGSITRPASYCGVAGCKPSYGRVSLTGVFPLAPSMDHPGPIARCVDDLALVFDAIAGYDPQDPRSVDDAPARKASGEGTGRSPVRPVLGVLGGMFSTMATDEVRESFRQALDVLQRAGASVSTASLPPQFDDILEHHRRMMATESAAVHEQRINQHPEDYGPCITELIQEGLRCRGTDYVRTRDHQVLTKRIILETLEGYDVLICPATTSAAPTPETTGNPAFNSPWSYTGLPTVSFPIGLSRDGLPLAVQLVGRAGQDTEPFEWARWCEQAIVAPHA